MPPFRGRENTAGLMTLRHDIFFLLPLIPRSLYGLLFLFCLQEYYAGKSVLLSHCFRNQLQPWGSEP
jgi:hypothetical protein